MAHIGLCGQREAVLVNDGIRFRGLARRHRGGRPALCFPVLHAVLSSGCAKGAGAIVEDVDGNRFLDFSAGIAVCSTGHCHPDVVRAIQEQAARLIHMSGTDFYYEQMPRAGARSWNR